MTVTTLVNLDDLKAYIDVAAGNSDFDRTLVELSGSATSLLEHFCRSVFEHQEVVEYFDTKKSDTIEYDLAGNYSNDLGLLESARTQRFPLKAYPIDLQEPVTVNYDASRQFSDSNLLTNNTDYFIRDTSNAIYLFKATVNSIAGLKVSYTAGYTTEEATFGTAPDEVTYNVISGAPEALKQACIMQTIFMFNKVRENNIGVVGTGEAGSPEYIQNELLLCPEAQALASKFRRSLVGRG